MFINQLRQLKFHQPCPIIYQCFFDVNEYNDALFNDYLIELPANLNKAAVKRKAEFLAGRICVKKCMESLNFMSRSETLCLKVGEHRAPVWPNDIIGSITHNQNSAIAIAGFKKNNNYIGIDKENFIKQDIAQQIKASLINENENGYLKQLANNLYKSQSFEYLLTIAFSCKESLFKALYPSVQRYFDFKDAQVIAIDLNNKQCKLKLLSDLSEHYKKNDIFTCDLIIDEDSVTSLLMSP